MKVPIFVFFLLGLSNFHLHGGNTLIQNITQKEKVHQVLEVYEKKLANDPDNVQLLHALGSAYYSDENYKRASELFARAYQLDPNDNNIRILLGLSYLFTDNLKESKILFETANKKDPENSTVLASLGRLAQLNFQFDLANEYYLKALRIDPKNDAALIFYADLKLQEKKYDEALKILDSIDNPQEKWVQNIIDKAKFRHTIDDIKQLESTGDLNKALSEYQELLKTYPDKAEIYQLLGNLYTKMKLYNQAIQLYSKAIALYPDKESLKVGMGFTYLADGKLSESKLLFDGVIEKEPYNTSAFAGLGRIAELQGHIEQAKVLYKDALEQQPYNAQALSLIADMEMRQKNYQEALIYYRKLEQIHPSSEWIKNAIVKAAYGSEIQEIEQKIKNKDYKVAEQLFQKLIKNSPNTPEVYYMFGQFYDQQKQYKKAIEIYNQGLKISPNTISIIISLGFSYLNDGNLYKSSEMFNNALELDPNNPSAISGLGKLAEVEGNIPLAESYYNKVLKIDKNAITPLVSIADLRMKQHRYKEAERLYEQIHELDPKQEWVKFAIENAKYAPLIEKIREREKKHDYDIAETLYLQLISLSPNNPDYYIDLGDLYQKMNRHQDAINLYEQGLKNLPNSIKLKNALAYAFLGNKDVDQSYKIFRDVLKTEPGNADALSGLGEIKQIQDNLFDAEHLYHEALKSNPNNIKALANLGNILMIQKRYSEAEPMFRQLLIELPDAPWVRNALQNIQFAPLIEKIVSLQKGGNFSKDEMNQRLLESEKIFQELMLKAPNNPQYYLGLGLLYAEMKRFSDAIRIYKNGLSIDPNNTDLIVAMGFSRIYEENYSEAKRIFEEVLDKNSQVASAWAGLGRVLELTNQYEEAERDYQRALEIDPENAIALSFIGPLEIKLNKLDKAKEVEHRLSKITPRSKQVKESLKELKIAPVMQKIAKFEQEKRYQEAANLLEEAQLELDQGADFYLTLGNLYVQMKRYPKAAQIFNSGLAEYPDSNELLTALGLAYVFNHELDSAQEVLSRAVQQDPNNPEAVAGLGRVAALSHQPIDAETLYLEALRSHPNNAAALSFYGDLLLEQKRYDAAVQVYKHLKELYPKEIWVTRAMKSAIDGPLTDKAKILVEIDELYKAKKTYLKLIGQTGDNPDYYLNLGEVLVSMEDYDEAIIVFRLGLQIDPDYPALWRAIAATYLLKGQYNISRCIYIALLTNNPEDAHSWAGLGRICALKGMHNKAKCYYSYALELNPDNETALIFLATGEAEQERFFSATRTYDHLRRIKPNDYWIYRQYRKMLRNTRPIVYLSGRYYEEDEWGRPQHEWIARYQVYGGRTWFFKPVNDTTSFSVQAAYQFYKLTDLENNEVNYFFNVGRGYTEVKKVHNTCFYSLLGLGVTSYAPYDEALFCQKTGVAIEPTYFLTYYTPKTKLTLGISSDTDIVARDFETYQSRLITRYYVSGRYEKECLRRVIYGLEGGYYYLNGFTDNQFQRLFTWAQWYPERLRNYLSFRYFFLYQNYNKIIPDYYTYTPQLVYDFQIEFNANWDDVADIHFGYSHGFQDTRTRFQQIIVGAPPILQPIFWDRRQYNRFFLRTTYDHCPLKASLEGDFYRDTTKYTIWSLFLKLGWYF